MIRNACKQDVSNGAQRALLHVLCLFNGIEVFEEVAPNIRQVCAMSLLFCVAFAICRLLCRLSFVDGYCSTLQALLLCRLLCCLSASVSSYTSLPLCLCRPTSVLLHLCLFASASLPLPRYIFHLLGSLTRSLRRVRRSKRVRQRQTLSSAHFLEEKNIICAERTDTGWRAARKWALEVVRVARGGSGCYKHTALCSD